MVEVVVDIVFVFVFAVGVVGVRGGKGVLVREGGLRVEE